MVPSGLLIDRSSASVLPRGVGDGQRAGQPIGVFDPNAVIGKTWRPTVDPRVPLPRSSRQRRQSWPPIEIDDLTQFDPPEVRITAGSHAFTLSQVNQSRIARRGRH